jgi:hypothetical protein
MRGQEVSMTDRDLKKVVNRLMGKDVLSYRLREDGFLVIINLEGWKVTFSPSEVENARQALQKKVKVEDEPSE